MMPLRQCSTISGDWFAIKKMGVSKGRLFVQHWIHEVSSTVSRERAACAVCSVSPWRQAYDLNPRTITGGPGWTDSDKFTIEDVMDIFGMWRWFAKLALGTGVRRGEFAKDGEFYRYLGQQ